MNILVTGANGFIGKNLVAELCNIRNGQVKKNGLTIGKVYEYDIETNPALLDIYTANCDFVFHLAGVNRPQNQDEFMQGNFGFTALLLESLKKNNNFCPVMISSSAQAALDNPYGQSKKAGETLVFNYEKQTCVKVFVYRFPNIFGKWCRPNYNSAVATFCNNVANDLPITVNDRNKKMTLVYIDDVIDELINALIGNETRDGNYCKVSIEHKITIGEIVDLIYSFKATRELLSIPNMSDSFTNKLYATYLSYLPTDKFSYPVKMNIDDRGSFTEIIRTNNVGQFSINITKPGKTKGNHWHHTKNEKYVVVSGRGVIRLRKLNSDKVIEYFVSGDKVEVVDIPVGYTHNFENLGDTDLVTFVWASECFDPDKPDTFLLKV